jgi:hypothetical protein
LERLGRFSETLLVALSANHVDKRDVQNILTATQKTGENCGAVFFANGTLLNSTFMEFLFYPCYERRKKCLLLSGRSRVAVFQLGTIFAIFFSSENFGK